MLICAHACGEHCTSLQVTASLQVETRPTNYSQKKVDTLVKMYLDAYGKSHTRIYLMFQHHAMSLSHLSSLLSPPCHPRLFCVMLTSYQGCVGGGKRGLVHTVCACASCVREQDFVNSRLLNGMNMRAKNADSTFLSV